MRSALQRSTDYRRLAPIYWETRWYRVLTRFRSTQMLRGLERREAEAAAREHARRLAEGTRRRVQKAVTRVGGQNLSKPQIAQEIARSAFSQARGGVIARTESRLQVAESRIRRLKRAGATRVLLSDGPGCGLRTHDDPRKANRRIVPLSVYERYPLAHPNCRRRVVRAILPVSGARSLNITVQAAERRGVVAR